MQSHPENSLKQREDAWAWPEHFAHRLSVMLDANAVEHQDVVAWANRVVAEQETPPAWMIDLALTRSTMKAVQCLRRFALSQRFDTLSVDAADDEYVGSLYLAHSGGRRQWAEFLRQAGDFTDSSGGSRRLRVLYSMLTAFEQSGFSAAVEAEQREQVAAMFRDVIDSVQRSVNNLSVLPPTRAERHPKRMSGE